MRARSAASRVLWVLGQFGVDPLMMARSVRGAARYAVDASKFRALSRQAGITTPIQFSNPVLSEYHASAGVASGHYFHQDLWAARRIFDARPASHVDVGSRIDGFVSHLLVFMPVTVIDVRPLETAVRGLTFVRSDASTMHGWADNSVPSLSSLHAVEHFGLGRYGDPVDPAGPRRAMQALSRVLAPGGRLYFSVPIGVERVEFNAHRVFDPSTILSGFAAHGLALVSFSAVDDHGGFAADVDPAAFKSASYSCGLFEFTK